MCNVHVNIHARTGTYIYSVNTNKWTMHADKKHAYKHKYTSINLDDITTLNRKKSAKY